MLNEYVLYVKKKCPFCVKAKKLLKKHKKDFNTIALDDAPDVWEGMKAAYNWSTVPFVLQKQKDRKNISYYVVGGHSDLVAHLEDE